MGSDRINSATCAVIPAAGFATRFLPATKTLPKELLPIVDRPALEYVVTEAATAGLADVLLVTGRGKTSMVDYFDRRPDLEAVLAAKGDTARLEAVRRPTGLAEIHTVRQQEIRGLGDAVGRAAAHVGDAPFAVLLPDEFPDPQQPVLPRMREVQAAAGGIVLALVEVPDDQVERYGVAAVTAADPALGADVVRITGLVEKPPRAEAPSNLIVFGRYLLPGSVFDAIARTAPGRGGEIQLTDAMALLLAEGTPVHGVVYRGARFDTGAPLGYLQAVVTLALRHPELGPPLRQWLAELPAEPAGVPVVTA